MPQPACLHKEGSACALKNFIPQPVWVAEWDKEHDEWRSIKGSGGEANGSNAVTAVALVNDEEMSTAMGSALGEGFAPAVGAENTEWEEHRYFMMELKTGKPRVLQKNEKDDYGNKFKAGDEVFDGFYMEEEDDGSGAGWYATGDQRFMTKFADSIGVD